VQQGPRPEPGGELDLPATVAPVALLLLSTAAAALRLASA